MWWGCFIKNMVDKKQTSSTSRSFSIPSCFLCRACTEGRSLPRSSVDRIASFSLIHSNVSSTSLLISTWCIVISYCISNPHNFKQEYTCRWNSCTCIRHSMRTEFPLCVFFIRQISYHTQNPKSFSVRTAHTLRQPTDITMITTTHILTNKKMLINIYKTSSLLVPDHSGTQEDLNLPQKSEKSQKWPYHRWHHRQTCWIAVSRGCSPVPFLSRQLLPLSSPRQRWALVS